MNDSNDKKTDNAGETNSCGNCDHALAFLVLRGWLGVRALLAGIEKYGAYKTVQKPLGDGTDAVVEMKVKYYALANYHGVPSALQSKFENEALLPGWTLNLFDKALGPALILAGVMLLLGLGTRASLLLQGLIYLMLTLGLILINQPDGIAYLGIHVALVAFALVLVKHNKFVILKKW
jgi:thiosulfate dehydrogenase [quinone] large subunit